MMYWGAEHHLLIKPCTERTLHEVLRRTFSFAHWLPDNALHGLVSNLQIIPSPPPLYTELLLELQSPQSSLDSVGQLISRDPAMTAKMLQLANSAALGLQQQVTDASTAVMYLGGETVKALVLLTYTFSYFDSYKPPESCLRALWTHLLVSAQCARLIGQVEGLQGEAAAKVFTAGVLHDLGKLVLAVNLPGPFAEAMEAARQYRRPLWKVERDLLGASHAEIGAALLGIWRVPDEIVEAVAWHHEPSRSSESSFRALTVVHAANVFAHERRPDDSGFAVPEVDENYLAELGLAHRVPLWRAACQSV
jgi:HD-like signal output (HDOD) protein